MSRFSPGELRLVRLGHVGGWLIAALMVAALVAGPWLAKREIDANRRREAADIQHFIAQVRACYRSDPLRRRSWRQCEDVVIDRQARQPRG